MSLSLGGSSGRDIGGLTGRGEASCLSLFLAVKSRERDWSPEVSRRSSKWGRAGEAAHRLRPVGPRCPLTGSLHLVQFRTGLATCTSPTLSLTCSPSARGAIRAGGGRGEAGGGRARPPSTSNTPESIRNSRLCSLRRKALGGRFLLLLSGAEEWQGFMVQEALADAG